MQKKPPVADTARMRLSLLLMMAVGGTAFHAFVPPPATRSMRACSPLLQESEPVDWGLVEEEAVPGTLPINIDVDEAATEVRDLLSEADAAEKAAADFAALAAKKQADAEKQAELAEKAYLASLEAKAAAEAATAKITEKTAKAEAMRAEAETREAAIAKAAAEAKAKADAAQAAAERAAREAAAREAAATAAAEAKKAMEDALPEVAALGVVAAEGTVGLFGRLISKFGAKVLVPTMERLGEAGKPAVMARQEKAAHFQKLVEEEKLRKQAEGKATTAETIAIVAGVTAAAAVEPVAAMTVGAAAVAVDQTTRVMVKKRLAAEKAAAEEAARIAAEEEAARIAAEEAAAQAAAEEAAKLEKARRRAEFNQQMGKDAKKVGAQVVLGSLRVGEALIKSALLVSEAALEKGDWSPEVVDEVIEEQKGAKGQKAPKSGTV